VAASKIRWPMRIALDPTIHRLLRDVSEGIRVLQSRDGVELSEKQIRERARNIVMGLVGNYRIESMDLGAIDEHVDAVGGDARGYGAP
jgi:hypothetical protein